MAQQPRERPGVYRTFPNQVLLRFSDDQLKRVTAAAKARSKTVSEFLRDAAMILVNEVQEDELARKSAQPEKASRAGMFALRDPKSVRGIDLQPPPVRQEAQSPIVEAPPQTMPTIVINTGSAASSGRDEVDVLADYVLAAKNSIDKMERERIATKIITDSSSDNEAQRKLAKALDDRIASRTPKQEKKSGWGFLTGGFSK